MVSFVCDDCGDTVKKPKVPGHINQCSASRFSCIDCGRTFDQYSIKGHTSCVTEHDKYAKGATKPGGYASQGFFGGGNASTSGQAAQDLGPQTDEFLSPRPPWRCSVCNVNCTSQSTLFAHAAGVKHRRRARAARAAANPEGAAADAAEPDAGTSIQQPDQTDSKQETTSEQRGEASECDNAAKTAGKKRMHLELAAADPEAAEAAQPKMKKSKKGKAEKKASAATADEAAECSKAAISGQQANGVATEPAGAARPRKQKGSQHKSALSLTAEVQAAVSSAKAERNGPATNGKADCNGAAAEGAKLGAKIKWRKLAVQQLQAQGGAMKLRKLQQAVLAAAGLAGSANEEQLIAKMTAKLAGDSRLVSTGKRIQLSAGGTAGMEQ